MQTEIFLCRLPNKRKTLGSFFSALGALNKVVGGDLVQPGRVWVPHGVGFNPFGFLQGV